MKPTLQIIVASTRPGRVDRPIADWYHEHATTHGGFEAELVDLAEWNLPHMDEPRHPRLRQYAHPHAGPPIPAPRLPYPIATARRLLSNSTR